MVAGPQIPGLAPMQYPLAWGIAGKVVRIPPEAVAFRVKRRRGDVRGPADVVPADPDDDSTGPLFIPVTATPAYLRQVAGAGAYKLEAVDAERCDFSPEIACYADLKAEPGESSAPIERAPAPAPIAPPAAPLSLLEEIKEMRLHAGAALQGLIDMNKELVAKVCELAGRPQPSMPRVVQPPAAPVNVPDLVAQFRHAVTQAQSGDRNPDVWARIGPAIEQLANGVATAGAVYVASKVPGGLQAMQFRLPEAPGTPGATAQGGAENEAIDLASLAEFLGRTPTELEAIIEQYRRHQAAKQAAAPPAPTNGVAH